MGAFLLQIQVVITPEICYAFIRIVSNLYKKLERGEPLYEIFKTHLTYAERMFLGAAEPVRHITLDPDGPGVVRIHIVPLP